MSKKYSTSKLFVYALLAGIPVSYGQIVINKPIEPKNPVVQQEQNTGFSLAFAYESYRNKDYQNAYDEFEHFVLQNNPKALMANAYLLFSGNLPRDFARANQYLAQVASLKYARAIYLQGLLEKYQKGLSQFNAKAERLVNDAAVRGDYVAANALANFHFQKGNYALAQRWNEKAISLGSSAARQNQRVISNRQSEPAIQTLPKTVSSPANTGVIGELRERSQAGDAGASYDLAVRFHKGVGVAVNFGEAIRLYQLAAEQGSSEAQKVLPILLSRRTTGGNINSMWMQRMSNMLPSPVVVQQDAHHAHTVKTENNIAGFDTEKATKAITTLQEDDPLEGLLTLEPSR